MLRSVSAHEQQKMWRFIFLPVEVLLQQVQPLLHLSVGEVRVAVVVPGRRLLTLGRLLCALAGKLTRPLLRVELWRGRRAQTRAR